LPRILQSVNEVLRQSPLLLGRKFGV
jgi:hypothetical protein